MLDFLRKGVSRRNMKKLVNDIGEQLNLVVDLAFILVEFKSYSKKQMGVVKDRFDSVVMDMMQKSGGVAKDLYWQGFQYSWIANDLKESGKAEDLRDYYAINLAVIYAKSRVVIAHNDDPLGMDFVPSTNIAVSLDNCTKGKNLEMIVRK